MFVKIKFMPIYEIDGPMNRWERGIEVDNWTLIDDPESFDEATLVLGRNYIGWGEEREEHIDKARHQIYIENSEGKTIEAFVWSGIRESVRKDLLAGMATPTSKAAEKMEQVGMQVTSTVEEKPKSHDYHVETDGEGNVETVVRGEAEKEIVEYLHLEEAENDN